VSRGWGRGEREGSSIGSRGWERGASVRVSVIERWMEEESRE
jgi:hypothetical protein